MKYVLPLSPDYVSSWSDWEAVRELLQNAMDAHDKGGEKPRMRYENKTLVVESPRERLERRTLLLGGTTKANDSTQRGKFGEGYKLALLVFCRKGYLVQVENGGEIWTPNFEAQEEFDGEQVLTIDIAPCKSDPYDGVRFTIIGFPEDAWELIKTRWRPDCHNDVILGWNEGGNIFCGGLWVTKSMQLLRGYNFSPSHMKLGRDRNLISDWDLSYHASLLWAKAPLHLMADMTALMDRNAADVAYVSHMPEQHTRVIVKEYEKKYGENTVPVENQKELDEVRSQGFNGQIVCGAMRSIVKSVKTFIFHELRTPGGKMKKFFEKHEKKMPLDAREDLEILVRESVGWR